MKVPLLMLKKYCRKHIGYVGKTNEGYTIKVIDGGSKKSYVTIQIEDWINEVVFTSVKKGEVKYPYHPSVCNTGYIGVGKYSTKTHKKVYGRWHSMLYRCHNPNEIQRLSTYAEVTICVKWYNFQNFAKWYEENYPTDGEEYDLDKDLLQGESKIYSPDTCIFIPHKLNTFMTNAQSNNASGYTGVYWNKQKKRWTTQMFINNKHKHLGHFKNIEDASNTYKRARAERAEIFKELYSSKYPKHILDRIK